MAIISTTWFKIKSKVLAHTIYLAYVMLEVMENSFSFYKILSNEQYYDNEISS